MTNWPFKSELADPAEFNRRWQADERFRAFASQVYGYLDRMRPGRVLRLDRYSGEKLDWIVLTAVAYICEGQNSMSHYFDDDYRSIRRQAVSEQELESVRRWRREHRDDRAAQEFSKKK